MKKILNSHYSFWLLLLLPSIPMVINVAREPGMVGQLLHPSGEFAARFMIIAMALSPIRLLLPNAKWPVWLLRRRRYLGVAAFGYALLHTVFYLIEKGAVQPVLDEFWSLGIWTGWLAFAVFVPLALTSNDWSQRMLSQRWKRLQRFVYLAAVMTLLHWIFIHDELGPALVHFVPLLALEAFRLWKKWAPPATTSRAAG